MKSLRKVYVLVLILASGLHQGANGQSGFIYGDPLPDAPELAARGNYKVGVQTIEVINRKQVDVLNYKNDSTATYDRKLKLEIWYPAAVQGDEPGIVTYDEVMGNANSKDRPNIPFQFHGRATRNAVPIRKDGAFPLVIVSHGYTGSRLLMTYLTENLASKGYVVAAIDHMESTFRDAAGFTSTLLNRAFDDLFVLKEISRLSATKDSFLYEVVNPEVTALIGYSMGGYGAVNVAGAGYSPQAVQFFSSISGGSKALKKRMIGNVEFKASMDPRIKVIVALAPWGMQQGVWNTEGLAGIKIPSLFIAGSEDDISGYDDGTKAIYHGAVNSDRYLLTYLNARHNVAPNPPPVHAIKPGMHIDEYLRYGDSVWDQRRINNINQHFVTAFLDLYLKKNSAYKEYLDVPENSIESTWKGFKPRTSIGLQMLHDEVK